MKNKLKVIYKQAKSTIPKIIEIDNELSILQRYVGGYLESLRLETNVALLMDEEGKLKK